MPAIRFDRVHHIACLLVVLFAGCSTGSGATHTNAVGFVGLTMGTTYTVKLAHVPPGRQLKKIHQEVDRLLDRLNGFMSTYLPDSEVSRFSKYRSTDWFSVSKETATVVAEAIRISRLTGGAFDITIAPLVNLWHFGPQESDRKIPTDDQILLAKQRVGYQHLQVRLQPPALRKDVAELSIDLSAIAKGYAVDRVAEYLESIGADDYLVEIGGETRTKGRKADGTPWRIGIEQPDPLRVSVMKVLEPGDRAVATSGDYRNYFEVDGQRFTHEIDPRTGHPVRWPLASVTVVAEQCMTADAWATALMVLGPEDGYNLAVQQKLPVLMVLRKKNGNFELKATPEFRRLFGQDP